MSLKLVVNLLKGRVFVVVEVEKVAVVGLEV